jgi:hypothetical protein
MVIYRHSVWLSVVQSVSGYFQSALSLLSIGILSGSSGWFQDISVVLVSVVSVVSGFSHSGQNFQSFRIKVLATGNKLSAVEDGTIQVSGCFSLVDLSRCFRMAVELIAMEFALNFLPTFNLLHSGPRNQCSRTWI